MKGRVLIIGAGLAGISSARLLADNDYVVDIYESLDHIGGNLYDYYNKGAYVHKYGPHIWHTNVEEVHQFVCRFTEMTDEFSHHVKAITTEGILPYPISLESAKAVLGIETKDEFDEYLNDFVVGNPSSMEEVMISKVGPTLYDLYVKGYTLRQWGKSPSELCPELAERVVVGSTSNGMFDRELHCTMPKYGYSKMLESMIDHPNINLVLNSKHTIDTIRDMHSEYDYVLISSAVDKLYDGEDNKQLPYVHVIFNHMDIPVSMMNPESSVYNHCVHPSSTEGNGESVSRVTVYNEFNNSEVQSVYSVGTETPSLTETEHSVPCYPITTYNRDANALLYRTYVDRILQDLPYSKIKFIGRLGTYSYLDMDKTILLSMKVTDDIINEGRN